MRIELDKLMNSALDILFSVDLVACVELFSIAEIEYDREVPTACLTLKNDIFKIKINPDFVRRYAFTPYRFAALLLHEVLHHFFEHFKEVESFTDITANIAQDAIINSVIDSLLPGLSELFKDLYSPDRFPEKYLRPGSVIDNEKWDETIWYLKL